jgi:PAS domain S-box-containing protein
MRGADGTSAIPVSKAIALAARAVADAAEVGLVLIDRGGRPLLVNRAARRLLGFGAAAVGLPALLRTLAATRRARRAVIAGIRRVLAGDPDQDPDTGSVEVAAANGRRFRVGVVAFPDEQGAIAGALLTVTDAGDRRLADEDLEQYAARLEQMVFERTRELEGSERKYRELFDAGPDSYLTLNRTGRIEEVNRTALRVTGFARRELVGRRAIGLLDPGARRAVSRAWPGFAEQGSVENLEFEVPRKDGQLVHVIASAVATRDGNGVVTGARVVVRDITHRTMLQRQLSTVDRLAATGKLAAGVAHEINNPLQAVLVHLSLVEEQLPCDFSERASWDRIHEGIRRIQQIVADLLDLHRGTEHETGPVDVNRVVGEALGLVDTPARHRGVTLTSDLAADLPAVCGNGRHLYQVVLNLLLNAIDALPRSGTVGVRTRQAVGQSQVEIDISDSGPGIPEELLAHIFDPFLTSRGKRGTGLGLFVTYGLVRQHGGRIQVDSAPGRGTTFRVFFPAEGGPPVDRRGDARSPGAPSGSP